MTAQERRRRLVQRAWDARREARLVRDNLRACLREKDEQILALKWAVVDAFQWRGVP